MLKTLCTPSKSSTFLLSCTTLATPCVLATAVYLKLCRHRGDASLCGRTAKHSASVKLCEIASLPQSLIILLKVCTFSVRPSETSATSKSGLRRHSSSAQQTPAMPPPTTTQRIAAVPLYLQHMTTYQAAGRWPFKLSASCLHVHTARCMHQDAGMPALQVHGQPRKPRSTHPLQLGIPMDCLDCNQNSVSLGADTASSSSRKHRH